MTTSSVSAVERDTDFTAELILNRVMNGQLATKSGKTINAASRLMATRHDATAFDCGVVAENVAYGKTIVQATQNALTELVDHVKKIRDICATDDPATRSQDVTQTLKAQLDSILATEVDNVKVLENTGLNLIIGINNNNETMTIGNANVLKGGEFNNLYDSLDDLTSESTEDIRDACDAAITELYGCIANQGVQYSILDNRYTLLNDLALTYHRASDEQAVHMGGSMSVLNAFS